MKILAVVPLGVVLSCAFVTDASSRQPHRHVACPGGLSHQYFWDSDPRIIYQERRDNNGQLCEPRERGSSGNNPFTAITASFAPPVSGHGHDHGHHSHNGHHGHGHGHEGHGHEGHGGGDHGGHGNHG